MYRGKLKYITCCGFVAGIAVFWLVSSQSRAEPKAIVSEAVALAPEDVVSDSLAYGGPGVLFVLNDGRVVVRKEDGSGRGLGVRIEVSGPLYLAHGGNEFYLTSDSVNSARQSVRGIPAVLRIPLVADPTSCAQAVMQITGWVQITKDDQGQWTLLAQDDSKQTFGITFDAAQV